MAHWLESIALVSDADAVDPENGSVTLIASVFGLQLSRVVLSIYMTAAGALLAGVAVGGMAAAKHSAVARSRSGTWRTEHTAKSMVGTARPLGASSCKTTSAA